MNTRQARSSIGDSQGLSSFLSARITRRFRLLLRRLHPHWKGTANSALLKTQPEKCVIYHKVLMGWDGAPPPKDSP
jgi:hypothetical protein